MSHEEWGGLFAQADKEWGRPHFGCACEDCLHAELEDDDMRAAWIENEEEEEEEEDYELTYEDEYTWHTKDDSP